VNGHSLFQKTYLRSIENSSPSDIYIITNELHHFLVKNQISELGYSVSDEQILLEPTGKNTLPAIAWGVSEIARKNPDAVIMVFPSDHLLGASAGEELRSAVPLSSRYLVTFGIIPDSPHTGYGYIAPGSRLRSDFV
jgi:mannose-1-phosphate guanylyltransferase/mannose-6-phosphate isomerase